MPEEETPHVGFKGTWKFIGWMIGAVIIIFDMIMNWIPAEIITSEMITKVLVIAAATGIGIPAIFYIADIIWTLANKVKETIYK